MSKSHSNRDKKMTRKQFYHMSVRVLLNTNGWIDKPDFSWRYEEEQKEQILTFQISFPLLFFCVIISYVKMCANTVLLHVTETASKHQWLNRWVSFFVEIWKITYGTDPEILNYSTLFLFEIQSDEFWVSFFQRHPV